MQRRRLPHCYPEQRDLFVTWHLAGSLPAGLYPPPGKRTKGEAFLWMDRFLDGGRWGPLWLARDEVAALVVRELRQLELWELHGFVVMANHVHVLFTSLADGPRVLQAIKGRTARQCNLLLGRTGAFWQSESYDRVVRDAEEWHRILRYIEMNPVKAGLVERAELFKWSSAFAREDAGLKAVRQAEGLRPT